VEEIVLLENAQLVTAVPAKECKTLPLGVQNTVGIKHAANALSLTNQEEMQMPSTTTLTHQLMLDSGKSTLSTGHRAQEEVPHVIPMSTSNVLLKFINGEETHGNSGQLIPDVDADLFIP
jgi:hypothetical protein